MLAIKDGEIYGYLTQIIDILLVTYVIYKLIMLIRGTKAVQLLKGITVIILVWFLSSAFNLKTLEWLMDKAITYGLLAIIIIFQPELRRALEQLGRGRFFSRAGMPEEEEMEKSIAAICKSTSYMAKRRIGAIISIERETGLSDYVETGIPLYAKLTSELLTNIFVPNTPLHDGAVIIKASQIFAAGCYLPLTESPFISKELGTRHRAAIGVSEVTDAVTVIVSEETGTISLTKNGEIYRNLDEESLKNLLTAELIISNRTSSSSRWNWRGKKNG
ncbi:diadenylate cyclase CdaA [Fictibacillus iocasae]|uniref:Diadenylate cyclase n=1 Tax=Fictibacillus iocasae TaxID=2715437 RepID=A0ABW2NQV5_9BACL